MTDSDTLMRYIRIFSDLSNQIRFATQKRVLVEIALIKLCRPAMETNLDSVLDRIRVLEQKIDERPVQQVIVQSTGVGEGSAEQPKPAERPPQKAAPEDLQKIVAGWKMIVRTDDSCFQTGTFAVGAKIQRRDWRADSLCGVSDSAWKALSG